jgi:phytanoyl-CoA hydroxylase
MYAPADFAENGVAVFPDAVSEQMLRTIRRRIRELVNDFDPDGVRTVFSTNDQSHGRDEYFLTSGDKTRFFFEDGVLDDDGRLLVDKHQSLNKIGHAMHDLDDTFRRFCRSDAFAGAASAVGMSDPRLLQSMVIFKNPEIGGEVTPHTDHTFLWTEPQSVIGFWLAIDEATQENGCLWALPGGHKIPVKSRFRRTPDNAGTFMETLDDTPYPTDGWVPLEAAPGTLIALHGTLPHRSAPNTSDRSRLAFTLHCVEGEARYPADNWLQRDNLPMRGFQLNDC